MIKAIISNNPFSSNHLYKIFAISVGDIIKKCLAPTFFIEEKTLKKLDIFVKYLLNRSI